MYGSTISEGCNNSTLPKGGDEEIKTLVVYGEKMAVWHQILWHVGGNGPWTLYNKGIVEGMSNYIVDI